MGDESYSAVVDENGIWTLPLSATDLAGFAEGTYAVSVTATDIAGNSSTINGNLRVDFTAPELTVANLAGDNNLNYADILQAQTLSGTAVGAEPGSVVTVSYNGTTLSTTVGAEGAWSLILTPAQLADLNTGANSVQITVADLAGNPTTETLEVTVDRTLPPDPVVTLGAVSPDNIISTLDGGTVAVSGTALNLGADTLVTVTIGGQITVPPSMPEGLDAGRAGYGLNRWHASDQRERHRCSGQRQHHRQCAGRFDVTCADN